MIKAERPDAAILDLNLLGEIASALIKQLANANVPCLIVSGYSEQSFPDEFRQFPSLEKPVICDRVIEKLAEALDEAQSARPLQTT